MKSDKVWATEVEMYFNADIYISLHGKSMVKILSFVAVIS